MVHVDGLGTLIVELRNSNELKEKQNDLLKELIEILNNKKE